MFNLFNRIMINLYLIATFLSIYMPIKTIMLYALTFFHYYFSLYFFYTIKNSNYKINIYVLFILLSLITSIFMSGTFAYYAIVNIIVIVGIYSLIEIDADYIIRKISIYIIIVSIINLFIYLLFPPDYVGMKIIAGITFNRVQLDFLPLSITSALALLSFILSENLKNRMLMYIVKAMNIILIIKLGKLSVIFTLVFVYLLVFILKYLYPRVNKYFLNSFLKIFYTILFFISLIIVTLKNSLDSKIIEMMTLRDVIYKDFLEYTFNYGSILLGNGFINNEAQVSSLSTNPHNQALGIFFILGIYGVIIFLLTFLKILENTLNSIGTGNNIHFKIFFAISLLMSMDSYFVLTTFPLYMIFIMFYLIKLPYIKENN